jgi:hypothetical protein
MAKQIRLNAFDDRDCPAIAKFSIRKKLAAYANPRGPALAPFCARYLALGNAAAVMTSTDSKNLLRLSSLRA